MIFWHLSVLQLIFLLASPFTSGICDSAREGQDTCAQGPSALHGVSPILPIPRARDAQFLLEEKLEGFISQAVPWCFCPRTRGMMVKAQTNALAKAKQLLLVFD